MILTVVSVVVVVIYCGDCGHIDSNNDCECLCDDTVTIVIFYCDDRNILL